MKRYRLVFLVLPLLLVQCRSTPTAIPKDREVTILFQSNRYGNLETCDCHTNPFGGIDREHNATQDIRKRTPNILMLDSGNLFVPSDRGAPLEYYQKRAKRLAPIFFELGLDVFAPGPNDLLLGATGLKELSASNSFRWVATNIRTADGSEPFPLILTLERAGIRFAIISASPTSVSTDWKILDPLQTLEKMIPEAVKASDFVILLSQLGNPIDIQIAERFPQIQLIVGSDSILSTDRPQWFAGHTLIVDPDLNGYLLGKLALKLKLPIKGLYSPVDLEINESLLKEYQERASAKDGKRYKDYADKLKSQSQLNIPEPGSIYDFELIKLDEARFGLPKNRFTQHILDMKAWVRKAALRK